MALKWSNYVTMWEKGCMFCFSLRLLTRNCLASSSQQGRQFLLVSYVEARQSLSSEWPHGHIFAKQEGAWSAWLGHAAQHIRVAPETPSVNVYGSNLFSFFEITLEIMLHALQEQTTHPCYVFILVLCWCLADCQVHWLSGLDNYLSNCH